MNEKHDKMRSNKRIFKNGLFFSLVLVITICLPLASFATVISVGPEDISNGALHTSESQAWAANGAAICIETDTQSVPELISDGAGCTIITWEDQRNSSTTSRDIYAQKINSAGITQWDGNGILICNAIGSQMNPQLVSDGVGGAIITWHDRRGGVLEDDIYAQKINSAGITQWDDNGTLICNANSMQDHQQIISDGAGGAIIVWEDERAAAPTFDDIFIQRVNSAGVIQWNGNGSLICNAIGSQMDPQLVSDGAGGAIITWEDYRNSGNTDYDIYAQKICSTKNTVWGGNGTIICNASGNQLEPQIIGDGAGGAIITWHDQRYGGPLDVFAQKINSAGNVQWSTNGTLICNALGNQMDPQICSDGAGGAIITWFDYRTSGTTGSDVYAQKITTIGIPQWDTNGSLICNVTGHQLNTQIISDGDGGAIITWQDERVGTNEDDIYAQKINSAGIASWGTNGTLICNASSSQLYPQIISDGDGGAIIAWQDERVAITQDDIYAQKIVDPPQRGGGGGGIPGFDLVIIGLISGIIVVILANKYDKKKRLIRK